MICLMLDQTLSTSAPVDAGSAPARRGAGRDFIGFLLVGGTGAAAFVILSWTLIGLETGLPEWIVSALCWVALILPVYLGHRMWSFQTGAPHRQALPRYVAVQVVGVILVSIFSYLCYRILGLSTVVAAPLVTALTTGVNFVILRAWAFAEGH